MKRTDWKRLRCVVVEKNDEVKGNYTVLQNKMEKTDLVTIKKKVKLVRSIKGTTDLSETSFRETE